MRWYIISKKTFYRTKTALVIVVLCALMVAFSVSAVNARHETELYAGVEGTVDESRLIILDAGHGGEDCGAVGTTGVLEKDLNMQLAEEIGTLLTEKGYTVIYTRTEDKLLYTPEEDIKGIRKISDLKNRCALANQYPSALFVSIHMNSYSSPKYSGLQVYYTDGNDASICLATRIQTSVRELLQTENNRTTKSGKGIYILENTEPVSVLIECGFLTNPEECKKLSEKEYQKQLSSAIVCGIIEYKEGK